MPFCYKHVLAIILFSIFQRSLHAQAPLEYPLDYVEKKMVFDKNGPYLADAPFVSHYLRQGILCGKDGKLKYVASSDYLYDNKGKRLFRFVNSSSSFLIDAWIIPDKDDTSNFVVIGVAFTNSTLLKIRFWYLKNKGDTVQMLSDTIIYKFKSTSDDHRVSICPSNILSKYYIVFKDDINNTIVIPFSTQGAMPPMYFKDSISSSFKDSKSKYSDWGRIIDSYTNNGHNKIISFIFKQKIKEKFSNDQDSVEIFIVLNDFDNTTGNISPGKVLWNKVYFNPLEAQLKNSRSIVFSASDNFIYFHADGNILQYEVSTNEIIPIHPFNGWILANIMTMGPDNRIYIFDVSNKLSKIKCIPYPDRKGKACGFIETSMKTTSQNFPNFLNTNKKIGFTYSQACNKIKLKEDCDESFYSQFSWHSDKDSVFGKVGYFKFPHSGKFLVSLQASNKDGYVAWYTDTVQYAAPAKAAFSAMGDTGCQWVGFHFVNNSSYDTLAKGYHGLRYHWDFGDGNTDTASSPTHIYAKPGNYTVRLVADNGFCTDTFYSVKEVVIKAAPKPILKLSATEGCIPFHIMAINTGDQNVSEQVFYSGKGDSIFAQEAAFTYENAGTYTIFLKVKGTTGCIVTDSALITVYPALHENTSVSMQCLSIIAPNVIELHWQTDSTIQFSKVERKKQNASWESIAVTNSTYFIDSGINTQNAYYEYRIKGIGFCGDTTVAGQSMSSLLLNVKADAQNQFSLLQWQSSHSGMQADTFYIERQLQDGSFRRIGFSKSNNYEDDSFYQENQLKSCYRLLVKYPSGCYGYSNQACADYNALLYIPNAFSPNYDVLNDKFEIFGSGLKSYHIEIYSRWGERIFMSDDISNSWDGSFKGKIVQDGCYFYIITAQGNKVNFYKKGTINVVK